MRARVRAGEPKRNARGGSRPWARNSPGEAKRLCYPRSVVGAGWRVNLCRLYADSIGSPV